MRKFFYLSLVIALILPATLAAQTDLTSISLNKGWNFVSFPKEPLNPDISVVLGAIASDVKIVWGFNNQTKQWIKYRPQTTDNSPQTLTTVEAGKGYWIYMLNSASIDLSNTAKWLQPASTTEFISDVKEGWNLIGHTGTDGTDVLTGLNLIADRWVVLWSWENGKWQAKQNLSANPLDAAELTALRKGKAYWIKLNSSIVFKEVSLEGAATIKYPDSLLPSGTIVSLIKTNDSQVMASIENSSRFFNMETRPDYAIKINTGNALPAADSMRAKIQIPDNIVPLINAAQTISQLEVSETRTVVGFVKRSYSSPEGGDEEYLEPLPGIFDVDNKTLEINLPKDGFQKKAEGSEAIITFGIVPAVSAQIQPASLRKTPQGVSAGSLTSPLGDVFGNNTLIINESFGRQRATGPHRAIDLLTPVGEKIHAVADAIGVITGSDDASGNYMILIHASGETSSYSHLSGYIATAGIQSISAGQEIAISGKSGRAGTAHLHFVYSRFVLPQRVKKGGNPTLFLTLDRINPMPFLINQIKIKEKETSTLPLSLSSNGEPLVLTAAAYDSAGKEIRIKRKDGINSDYMPVVAGNISGADDNGISADLIWGSDNTGVAQIPEKSDIKDIATGAMKSDGGQNMIRAGNAFGKAKITVRDAYSGKFDEVEVSLAIPLTAKAISSHQINLSWISFAHDVDSTSYMIYRDGLQIATTNTASYLNTELTANTQYCYIIEVFDANSNLLAKSSQSCVTTPAPDTQAPYISALSIPSNCYSKLDSCIQTQGTNPLIITITLSATDNIGITKYNITYDSNSPTANDKGWVSLDSPQTNYSDTLLFEIDPTKIKNGYSRTIYLWVKDADGNIAWKYKTVYVEYKVNISLSSSSGGVENTFLLTGSPVIPAYLSIGLDCEWTYAVNMALISPYTGCPFTFISEEVYIYLFDVNNKLLQSLSSNAFAWYSKTHYPCSDYAYAIVTARIPEISTCHCSHPSNSTSYECGTGIVIGEN